MSRNELNTLYPFNFSYAEALPKRQGRSRKRLKPVIECDGTIFIARYEGRPERFFAPTEKAVLNHLQEGAQ
jgi:hypothetical protein